MLRLGDSLGALGTGDSVRDLLWFLGSVAERGTYVPARGFVELATCVGCHMGISPVFGFSRFLGSVSARALAGHLGGLSGTCGAVVTSCGRSSPASAACAASSSMYCCSFLRASFFSSFFFVGSLILMGSLRFFFSAWRILKTL